jgi:predicted MFS family arabinose efflux permease
MYGTLSFLPFLGTFSGSLLGVRLSKFKPVFALKIAFLIESICALSMFLFFKSGVLNVYTLLIPMIVFCIGHPIIVSTAYSVSMAQKEDKANSSAVVNFVGMCVSVFGILILNTIKDNSILIMPSIFLLCMLAMVLTYAFIQLKTVRNDL